MQNPIAGAEPAQGREQIVAGAAVLKPGLFEKSSCGDDPFGSDEPVYLEPKRAKRSQINDGQKPQEQPRA